MAQNFNHKTTDNSGVYDNNGYGQLYSWDEAMKYCPNGWHLPSTKDWYGLYVGVTDEFGFNLDLPGETTCFWCSDERGHEAGCLYVTAFSLTKIFNDKNNRYSVRYLKGFAHGD